MVYTPATIAIVDDEPSVRRALGRLVGTCGLRAEVFAGGRELLARCRADPAFQPDCILLDIHMPEVSGLEVQQALRHAGRAEPVVFVTADERPAQWQQALIAGSKAVLAKPVTANLLIRALRDAGVSVPDPASAEGPPR